MASNRDMCKVVLMAIAIAIINRSNGEDRIAYEYEDTAPEPPVEYVDSPPAHSSHHQPAPLYPDGYQRIYDFKRFGHAEGFVRRQDSLFNTVDILGFATLAGFGFDGFNAYYTSLVDTKQRDTCNRVNQLLQIAKFNGTADDLINPTSGTYSIGAVLSHIAAGAFTNTAGLTTQAPAISAVMATGANPNAVGISVADFNNFRLLVGEAIDLLDKKIDEMLNVQALTCSIS